MVTDPTMVNGTHIGSERLVPKIGVIRFKQKVKITNPTLIG